MGRSRSSSTSSTSSIKTSDVFRTIDRLHEERRTQDYLRPTTSGTPVMKDRIKVGKSSNRNLLLSASMSSVLEQNVVSKKLRNQTAHIDDSRLTHQKQDMQILNDKLRLYMNHEKNLKRDIERERQRQFNLRENAKDSASQFKVLNAKIEALTAPKQKVLIDLREELKSFKIKCANRRKELASLKNKKETAQRELAVLGTEQNFWESKWSKLKETLNKMGKMDMDDQRDRKSALLSAIKREAEKFQKEKLESIELMRKKFGDNMAKYSFMPHVDYRHGRDELKIGLQRTRAKIQNLPKVVETKKELQVLRDRLSALSGSKTSLADLENQYFDSRQRAIELRHKSKDRRSEVDRVKEQLHLKQSSFKDMKAAYQRRADNLWQEIRDLEAQLAKIRSNHYNHTELEVEIKKMKKLLKDRSLSGSVTNMIPSPVVERREQKVTRIRHRSTSSSSSSTSNTSRDTVYDKKFDLKQSRDFDGNIKYFGSSMRSGTKSKTVFR